VVFDLRVITRAAAAVPSRERLPAGIQVLVGAGFLVAIGYGIVAPALPLFADSLGVGVTGASLVVSTFAVFRLVFAPASGTLIDRSGELRVFCGGLLIVGLSSGACAFAENFTQLLVLRSLGGIGSTMFTVSAAALLLRVSPPTMRGRAAGAWATGFLVGCAAGPAVGGWLIGLNPRAPFLIYAGVLVVVAAGAVVALRGRIGPRPIRTESARPAAGFASAWQHPTFRAAMTTNFLNGWTAYGVRVALVPLFVVSELHWSAAWAGAALTAFAIGTAATSSVGGRWADRYGRRPPILAGLAVVAITMCWLGFSTSPFELLAVAVLSGAGTGLMNPPSNAAVNDVIAASGGAGPALAAYQMVGDVGAIVGPVVAGMVAEWGGYPIAFGLTAVIGVASFTRWHNAPETVVNRK
jgi:MFS family permease